MTPWLRPLQATVESGSSTVAAKLEAATLGWSVVGVFVLAYAAIQARSVALAGFGLDSLIEIGASAVVLWELADVDAKRQHLALRLIGAAFVGLALYLGVQSTIILLIGFHPHHSVLGIAWTAMTACVMFGLAFGKASVGAALGDPVLRAEGRITMIDGMLATAELAGLVLNALAGWWWADPIDRCRIRAVVLRRQRGTRVVEQVNGSALSASRSRRASLGQRPSKGARRPLPIDWPWRWMGGHRPTSPRAATRTRRANR